MIKKLTYFNLVYGTVYFFQVINGIGPLRMGDYIYVIGLILIIWYNWETLKIINGQKRRLSKLSFAIGLITILFACIMIADSILRFIKMMDFEDMIGGLLFLIGLEFVYATTIMIQTIWTIKKYLRLESTTANNVHI